MEASWAALESSLHDRVEKWLLLVGGGPVKSGQGQSVSAWPNQAITKSVSPRVRHFVLFRRSQRICVDAFHKWRRLLSRLISDLTRKE
jgi:hypothetical protein